MIQINSQNRQRSTDLENGIMVAWRRGWGGDSWGVWDGHVLTAVFQMVNKDLLYSKWNSAHCCVVAWMGGKFGGEGIHVSVWLSPFAVCLKLSISYIPIQN